MLLALLCAASRADDSGASRARAWPDSYLSRVEALALLETFNADLLSHDSATLTLERWCAAHRLAAAPRIVAERVTGAERPPSTEQRQELQVGPQDTVRHRHVRLRCGPAILSEADNWYVPRRLTPQMNRLLDTSDIPFGTVAKPLQFRRRTLSSSLLWQPLPAGWEMQPQSRSDARHDAADLSIPARLLEHRALLVLPDGTPISEVIETYTAGILGFPPPP